MLVNFITIFLGQNAPLAFTFNVNDKDKALAILASSHISSQYHNGGIV
jgi:hypothetical protein